MAAQARADGLRDASERAELPVCAKHEGVDRRLGEGERVLYSSRKSVGCCCC